MSNASAEIITQVLDMSYSERVRRMCRKDPEAARQARLCGLAELLAEGWDIVITRGGFTATMEKK